MGASEVTIPPLPPGFTLDELPPLPKGYRLDNPQARPGQEQPEVLNPQGVPGASSDEIVRGLFELGGMVGGAGIGANLARRGAQYAIPKIADALGTVPRFLGVTEPGAAAVGRVAGSGLGGGLGAVAGDIAVRPPSLASTLDVNVPNLKSTFSRGVGEGLVGEGLGQGLVKGMNVALSPLMNKVVGGPIKAPSDLQVLQDAQRMGVTLRPAEVTQNDVAAQIEQNARRSMFGKGKFQELDMANEPAFRGAIESYADRVFGKAQTDQTSGGLIQAAIKDQAIPEFKAVTRGLYQRLSTMTGDAPIVDTKEAYNLVRGLQQSIDPKVSPQAAAIVERIASNLSESGYTTGMKVTRRQPELPGPTTGLNVKTITDEETGLQRLRVKERSEGQPVPGPLEGLKVETRSEGPARPKAITFMQAHDIRSDLLDLGRTGEVLPDRVAGLSSRLAGALDSSMEKAAKQFDKANGTTLEQDWRVANASVKAMHEIGNSQVIKRALSANPEDVVKVGFQKNAQTETNRIMEVLKNDPISQNIYRRAALQDLMKKAETQGFLNGQSLFNAAYGKNGIGDEVMVRTFGEEHAAELKRFFEVGRRMNLSTLPQNAGNASQTGRSLINWFEQAMLINIPANFVKNTLKGNLGPALTELANDMTGAGTYILTQKQLANLLNSPEGTRLLTQGMSMKTDFPNVTKFTQWASRLLAIAGGHAMAKPEAIGGVINQTPNIP